MTFPSGKICLILCLNIISISITVLFFYYWFSCLFPLLGSELSQGREHECFIFVSSTPSQSRSSIHIHRMNEVFLGRYAGSVVGGRDLRDVRKVRCEKENRFLIYTVTYMCFCLGIVIAFVVFLKCCLQVVRSLLGGSVRGGLEE